MPTRIAACLTDGFSGLVYCLHRYYDPTSCRWTSRDPIGLDGGMNVYGYCGGDPVLGVDPSGLDWNVRWFGVDLEFSGDGIEEGLETSAAAAGNVASFGIWDGGRWKDIPGFNQAVASWMIADVALGGAGVENLSLRGVRALSKPLGHAVEKHFGQTFAYLAARNIKHATSFYSNTVGNLLIRRVIGENQAEIATWLASRVGKPLVYKTSTSVVTGYGLRAGAAKELMIKGLTVVLKKDGKGGYYLLTAYPGN